MKIQLTALTSYYRDLYSEITPFTRRNDFFTVYFEQKLSKIANERGFEQLFRIPDYRKLQDIDYFREMSEMKRSFVKELKNTFPKEIYDEQLIHTFNIYFLNESLQCLDRSIYWLLNYYRNLDQYSLQSCIQNFYYSEFFIHASISRYLGLASIWIHEIGKPIKIERIKKEIEGATVFEAGLELHIEVDPRTGASHESLYTDIRRYIGQHVNLPESVISDWFKPTFFTSLLKGEREKHVYNISHPVNDPWNPLNERQARYHSEICFLGGPKLSSYPNDAGEYLEDRYGNWGYLEHHMGNLIRWMATQLVEINALNEIRDLRRKIANFDKGSYPEVMNEPMTVLLSWLPEV